MIVLAQILGFVRFFKGVSVRGRLGVSIDGGRGVAQLVKRVAGGL